MRDHSGVPILAAHDLFVLADLRGATIKLEGALAHQVRATIDVSSIRFCDKEMLARFSKIQYIAEYLKAKQEEVASWNAERGVDPASLADGRLGTFRAYVVAYLRHHPMLHQHMTLLVRQLAPTDHGLPIEIYVFSSDQVWSRYEAIQADIFDHLLAVVPEFDLRVFQSPTGRDHARRSQHGQPVRRRTTPISRLRLLRAGLSAKYNTAKAEIGGNRLMLIGGVQWPGTYCRTHATGGDPQWQPEVLYSSWPLR